MTGVPNYFGEQRFGRECGNLLRAEELLVQRRKVKDRFLKGLEGLKHYGLEEAWRSNILHVNQLTCLIKGQTAELSFTLPAGAYATSVLSELVVY